METPLKGGRYRIEEVIGGGGMGVVSRALDTRLNCKVALKEIRPEHLHDAQFRLRLKQEAIAAAAINHAGIARAFDFVDDGAEVFVIYEFVEGVTLRQRLKDTRLRTEEILEIAIKAASALHAAHELGFIHRDLKPENIMLIQRPEDSVRIKIVDFGLTKRISFAGLPQDGATTSAETGGITSTGMMIIGTIDYMSPEQLRMEKADYRSDIYSLGLVIYEMATGVNPFRGGDPSSTIAHILTYDPPALGDRNSVSPLELDRIVRKCLHKKREERYQSARELVVDLEKLRRDYAQAASDPARLTPAPVSAPSPPPPNPKRRVARALFALIQVGYLAMYALAFNYLPEKAHRIPWVFDSAAGSSGLVLFVEATLVVLAGAAALRLYFLAALAFEYEEFGGLFRRVFPIVLLVDLAWAISPLLLFYKLGFILVLGVPCLASLPFSQRTLMSYAYPRRGGGSSVNKSDNNAHLATPPAIGPPLVP